jgi:pimeloyl-ACP methyl ester carboxylesterase
MLRAMRILLAALLGLGAIAPAQEPDPDPLRREIRVPLDDGRISLLALGRALCDAYGLDGDVLAFADRSIDLRGARGFLLTSAGRLLLLDTVELHRRSDELVVSIDRERAQQVRRRIRTRILGLLGKLSGEDLLAREYSLELPAGLRAEEPLVVLVHGVDSSPEALGELRAFLQEHEPPFQVGAFRYPNDEAPARVAAELSTRLRALGRQPVAIVAHSMGGLVARAVLEDPELDPGNVTRLLMIGTPNRGSRLAGTRIALDAARVLRESRGTEDYADALREHVVAALRDGLGEAGIDLLPDSVFLTRLERCERNPNVAYHLVLGTRAPLDRVMLATVGGLVLSRFARLDGSEILLPKARRFVADLDELIDGSGDGAVSVARGRLAGVEPVLVPLDHVGLVHRRGILAAVPDGEPHPVFAQVARWLRDG